MVKAPVKVESIAPELLELIGEEHQAWRNALPAEELARYSRKYIATRKKQIVGASKSLRQALEHWGYIKRPKTPWLRVAPKFHPKKMKIE